LQGSWKESQIIAAEHLPIVSRVPESNQAYGQNMWLQGKNSRLKWFAATIITQEAEWAACCPIQKALPRDLLAPAVPEATSLYIHPTRRLVIRPPAVSPHAVFPM